MKPSLLILALTFLWTSAAIANDKLYREDGTEIRYYLDNPNAKNLLVVFQGSDCNSVRHMESVQTIWQSLAPDSALLTIEKYGIDSSLPYAKGERGDCPTPYLKHDTIGQRVKDATRLLETLEDSYQEITLVGGSEGGSVALGVAAQDIDIHSVLSLNSGSSNFQHDVEYSIQQTVHDDQLAHVLQEFRQFAKQIVESKTPFTVEVSGHGYAFWRDVLTRNLLAPLNKINAPVLVMQSTDDKSVDPAMTQREIQNAIKNGASNIQLIMLPGLDHGFRDTTGSSKLREVIEEAAITLEKM